jgi:hypothetical protein
MNNTPEPKPALLFSGRAPSLDLALDTATITLGPIQNSYHHLKIYHFKKVGWCKFVWAPVPPEELEANAPGMPPITVPRKFMIYAEADPHRMNLKTLQFLFEHTPEQVLRLRPHPDYANEYIERLHIAEGSGIVARIMPDGQSVSIYYEGNLYGSCNLNTLEEKEHCAAGRLTAKYPTVARTSLPSLEELLRIFEVTIWTPPEEIEKFRQKPVRGLL